MIRHRISDAYIASKKKFCAHTEKAQRIYSVVKDRDRHAVERRYEKLLKLLQFNDVCYSNVY